MKTKKEILEKMLDEENENVIRLKANVRFYVMLAIEKPKDENILQLKNQAELGVQRKEKLVGIVEDELKKLEGVKDEK